MVRYAVANTPYFCTLFTAIFNHIRYILAPSSLAPEGVGGGVHVPGLMTICCNSHSLFNPHSLLIWNRNGYTNVQEFEKTDKMPRLSLL